MELKLIKNIGRHYPTENSKSKSPYGIFLCSCGKEFKAIIYNVKSNSTKSC